MKKYNLKRFLASLLAVLMLASVTGVSPAVFAEDNGSTPRIRKKLLNPYSRINPARFSSSRACPMLRFQSLSARLSSVITTSSTILPRQICSGSITQELTAKQPVLPARIFGEQ